MSFPDALERAAAVAMTVLAQLKQKQPKPGDRGEIECPTCGGPVPWAAVGRHSHLRAWCEGDGCFELME